MVWLPVSFSVHQPVCKRVHSQKKFSLLVSKFFSFRGDHFSKEKQTLFWQNCFLCKTKSTTTKNKKRQEKNPRSATSTNRSPSQTPRERGNRQNQTSANRTNVRKALRLALSSPSEVTAMLKGLKNTRTK